MPNPILLVDDDVELTQMLGEYLGAEGFDIALAHDGQEAASLIEKSDYDLIVLDLMLPGLNGFEVLTRMRQTSMTPVLMLTARGTDEDRIAGLDLGADDYLPKPFNPRELVARIRAILRRFAVQDSTAVANPPASPLQIDSVSFSARLNGIDLSLTGTEFRLLELLAREPGDILSRDQLAQQVLGRTLSPLDRSVDTHISNIRRKMAAIEPDLLEIKSLRGRGYVLSVSRGAVAGR